ncbi:hypothetical protein A7985_02350 [Pseudoalteromonas luteoviolacea]|uniref:DUF3703 domain-containing protein n=1 Tax=Pseudoalteromonas luteoviolacea TaxID=43657 RepID=A0A1C0TU28_9GAMM|nr:DUF3703 domain-containing protein [Pseudoalteromonas luteoviolacea]MBQ4811361.1 DUF3703 domain-containing protein [Pseudoalteromonas luteoviolacea]OCQ22818.1 hypothetical protein A7985_02350 [Pseudoalteromonas luteoviolacea]
MRKKLKTAYEQEMANAKSLYRHKQFKDCFYHLERAHILGQKFTFAHINSHWWMLKVGIKTKSIDEVMGQCTRIVAALIFSRIWVPNGNTGGTNINAFKSLPIPDDLQKYLDK